VAILIVCEDDFMSWMEIRSHDLWWGKVYCVLTLIHQVLTEIKIRMWRLRFRG
jgi:hypothetical protein